MLKKVSVSGLIVAGLYVIGTIALVYYSSVCLGDFCQTSIIFAILPWVVVLDYLSINLPNSELFFWGFVIIDTLLIYFIFVLLQHQITRYLN